MGRLNDKVAIISGAASGMGVTHAELFVREGAKVVVSDVNDKDGAELAERLGDAALFAHHDVTDPDSWSEVVATAEAAFGPVGVLVNNAGVSGGAATTLELTIESYLRTIDVDQHGIFYGMRAVLPGMIEAGGGSIVNLSSAAGIVATKGFPNAAYVAAKFAVRGLTKAAAIEYAAQNVRVNSVHPGAVGTPLTEDMFVQLGDEFRRNYEGSLPMKRIARPEEVSALVVYLASDESGYTTGTEHIVDGGLTAE